VRVLAVVNNNPKEILLIEVGKESIHEIARLLGESKRDEAIVAVLTKGNIQGRFNEEEASRIEAELLLTREGTHWSLV